MAKRVLERMFCWSISIGFKNTHWYL